MEKRVREMYLFRDEAQTAAEFLDGCAEIVESVTGDSNFDFVASDVPCFSGNVSCFDVFDKSNNWIGTFAYWDVREED